MEYVESLDGFSEVRGTDGLYLQNGEIVVRADSMCIMKPHTRTSGRNAGYSYYRLRLKDGRRTEWSFNRVFNGKRGYCYPNSTKDKPCRCKEAVSRYDTSKITASEIARREGLRPETVSRYLRTHDLPRITKEDFNRKLHEEALIRPRKQNRSVGTIPWRRVMEFYETDICYLCGDPVDVNDYYWTENGAFCAGPNYPSTDHVIAVANGGDDSIENSRIAHHRCNSLKSATPLDEYLEVAQ